MNFKITSFLIFLNFAISYSQLDTTNIPIINYLLQTEKTYPASFFPSYKSPYTDRTYPNVQINGKDSFPLVWYDGIEFESLTSQNEALARIPQIAQTGANGIVFYFGNTAAYYLNGTIPTNSFINQYFDEASNHNLSVMLGVHVALICNYVHNIEREENLNRILNYVTHYSQRTTLSGWYLYDEPSIGEFCRPAHPENTGKYEDHANPLLIDPLITLYDTIKTTLAELGKEDQHVFMVDIPWTNPWTDAIAPSLPKGWADSENNVHNARYALATDYVMWDHYPVGDEIIHVPLAQDSVTNAISKPTTIPDLPVIKPVLPVLLAENQTNRIFNTDPDKLGECQKAGITNRQECFEKMYLEQRYAFYSSIVHGARGVFHYMYRLSAQEIISNITTLYSEFNHIQLPKMLLLPSPTNTSLLVDYKFDRDNNSMNDLNYILREWNGKFYVIAVNDSKIGTGNVHFRLINKEVLSVSVLKNQAISNSLEIKHQNVFGDSFKPFEVKIYEITTTP